MTKMSKTRIEKRIARQKKRIARQKLQKIMGSGPKLWSVPIPKHTLPQIGGKVRLYHYTPIANVGSIMTHGLIKGDVLGDNYGVRNWNAPNLTSENTFHNPANRTITKEVEDGYIRLEIYFEETDENIVPFGWFDRTYCNGLNRKVIRTANQEGQNNGNIETQYLYKGFISPKMIKKISVWNEDTGYWDRLSQTQIKELVKEYSLPKLSFCGKNYITYDWLRMCGHSLNDWTGKIEAFYEKTDEYEVFSPLYELTDFINNHLKGSRLGEYKMTVQKMMFERKIEQAFQHIIKTYNKLSNNPVGEEWSENLRTRQKTWGKFYSGNPEYQKKVA